MSELAYVAKMSDIELSSLSNAIKKMQVNLSEAASGGKAQIETLRALGLVINDLKGMAPDKQFEVLADRINMIKDPADRARAAVELFGKAGAELLPLFEKGAAGIRAARIEAQRMGASFSDEQIKKLAEADDAIKRLKASWEGFATRMTAFVAPAITKVLDLLNNSQKESIDSLRYKLQSFEHGTSEEAIQRTKELKEQIAKLENVRLGGSGTGKRGPGPRGSMAPHDLPGFTDTAAEEAAIRKVEKAEHDAAAAAEKHAEAIAKWQDELVRAGGQDMAMLVYQDQKAAQDKELAEMEERTATHADRVVREYDRTVNEINKLRSYDVISEEEKLRRLGELQDDFNERYLSEATVTAERIGQVAEKANSYQMDLAQGTTQIIADTIRGSFDGAFKDVPKRFQMLLLELAIQAQAAKIGEMIFGSSGTGGAGGWLGKAGDFALGLFGGGRATGGPVQPGRMYKVNENTPNSEWFMPSSAGHIIPNNGAGSMGMTVYNQFTVHTPNGSISRQTEQQLAAAAGRGIAQASRRNNG